jgi:hypothetical protein
MHTFKLGAAGFAIAFEFSDTLQVARGRQRPRCLLASNRHRQRYLTGRVEESRLKLAGAAALFPASHDASR